MRLFDLIVLIVAAVAFLGATVTASRRENSVGLALASFGLFLTVLVPLAAIVNSYS